MNKTIIKKLMMIILFVMVVFLFGCGENEESDKDFLEIVSETTSYKIEGIMESFYLEGRKQNEFTVYYKGPEAIKIVLKAIDGDDSQIILKNKSGVYVLIPTINKNFKIQSSWPNNASYPYLLQSLAKDIANTENIIKTSDEKTDTFETDTYLYKDAIANKQKIVIDKETCLPKEVSIYDKQGELYIRVVFTNITLDATIDDKEFEVDDAMTTLRAIYDEEVIYENRSIKYPLYCPEGSTLAHENTKASSDGLDVVSIMTYTGTAGFTIVQEYVNDQETIAYAQESGEIIHIYGVPTILKENSVQTIYQGVEYIIASTDLSIEEMSLILASYMDEIIEK